MDDKGVKLIKVAAISSIILFSSLSFYLIHSWLYRDKKNSKKNEEHESTYSQLIGNTPLVKLVKLSNLIERNIYVKMESLNPGGTGKDRAVKYMLNQAISINGLKGFSRIYEGTSGSTGISLAFQCNSLGVNLTIVMPDDQSEEKINLLKQLGAEVIVVPTCSINNKNHYVNHARNLAKQNQGIFIDQFENISNFNAHYETTGPEIWNQLNGKLDAFVMSAGTGGTIAGVSCFLKEKNPEIDIVLADPNGSSLFNKVLYNVCYTKQQSERTIRKHRYDSIVEGVGLDRITKNFKQAKIDHAIKVEDQEILEMAHWVLKNEGLFIGSSSALNIAAAIKYSKSLPKQSSIVTVVCDGGSRHMSRFWNKEYIKKYDLEWPSAENIPNCI